MGIGHATYLNRVTSAIAAVVVAVAVTMFALPNGSSPGIDQALASTGVAQAAKVTGRLDLLAKPDKPKADKPDEPELGQVANAAGEPLDVDGACAENLAIAAKQGLTLPDGWDIQCVGPGLDWEGNSHWGVTCPYDDCPEGAGPYVSVSNPTYYVIAHELCHANYGNDELMADRCAAKHGASLDTSPYS